MASMVKYYETHPMEKAKIKSITSEAAGHPGENLLDNNLDTYWKPTSSSTQVIEFDLGTTRSIWGLLIFVRNYQSLSSGSVDLHWSSDGSNWSDAIPGSSSWANYDSEIHLRTNSLYGIAARYWKAVMSMNTPVELGGWWFCRLYHFTGNAPPEVDGWLFDNQTTKLPHGRELYLGYNRNPRRYRERRYLCTSSIKASEFRQMFNYCQGRRFPLLMVEDDNITDSLLGRLDASEIEIRRETPLVYEVSLRVVELPFRRIADEVY